MFRFFNREIKMNFHHEAGCKVKLIGWLKEIPDLKMDLNGNFFTTIKIYTHPNQKNTSTYYRVFASKEKALRIRQYGFPSAYLLIKGVLTGKKKLKIIANKISFLTESNSNNSNLYTTTLCLKSKNNFVTKESYFLH